MKKKICIRLEFPYVNTTKKLSYCSIFFLEFLKTAVIEKPVIVLFETTSIGNPIRQHKTGTI